MATLRAISRVTRDLVPAHYMLTIKSYSQLLKAEGDKYESGVFKVGGYNWKLILYPKGKKNAVGYVSLDLAIDDSSTNFATNERPVSVNFRFFVHDQKNDKYLSIQYEDGEEMVFDQRKRQWGIDRLLTLKALMEPKNGYLIGDTCVFGAEIFVIKTTGRGEVLSVVEELPAEIFKWELKGFKNLDDRDYYSDDKVFEAGGRKWQIVIRPKGEDGAKEHLSFYISLQDSDDLIRSKRKLYAKYKMRIVDLRRTIKEEQTSSCWFSIDVQQSGYPRFMSLEDLKSQGYLIDGTLRVEVEFLVVSELKEEY